MEREEILLSAIKEDIHELKESHKDIVQLMQKNARLEEKLIASNAKHDEGRKVLHKRIDVFFKIAFWLGTTIFVGMGGVIFTLIQRVYQ